MCTFDWNIIVGFHFLSQGCIINLNINVNTLLMQRSYHSVVNKTITDLLFNSLAGSCAAVIESVSSSAEYVDT